MLTVLFRFPSRMFPLTLTLCNLSLSYPNTSNYLESIRMRKIPYYIDFFEEHESQLFAELLDGLRAPLLHDFYNPEPPQYEKLPASKTYFNPEIIITFLISSLLQLSSLFFITQFLDSGKFIDFSSICANAWDINP